MQRLRNRSEWRRIGERTYSSAHCPVPFGRNENSAEYRDIDDDLSEFIEKSITAGGEIDLFSVSLICYGACWFD